MKFKGLGENIVQCKKSSKALCLQPAAETVYVWPLRPIVITNLA